MNKVLLGCTDEFAAAAAEVSQHTHYCQRLCCVRICKRPYDCANAVPDNHSQF